MSGDQSRSGNSNDLLLGLLGKGFDGYFKAPEDAVFKDLLARLDDAPHDDMRDQTGGRMRRFR